MQIGWVYGHNQSMDALEYHRGSEVMAAVTGLVLLLGDYREIHWTPRPSYDASGLRAFYAPRGAVFELYPLTLHYAPLEARSSEGFIGLVALPRLTNTPLAGTPARAGESALLQARDKWLLAHPEAAELVRSGASAGIAGANLHVRPLD